MKKQNFPEKSATWLETRLWPHIACYGSTAKEVHRKLLPESTITPIFPSCQILFPIPIFPPAQALTPARHLSCSPIFFLPIPRISKEEDSLPLSQMFRAASAATIFFLYWLMEEMLAEIILRNFSEPIAMTSHHFWVLHTAVDDREVRSSIKMIFLYPYHCQQHREPTSYGHWCRRSPMFIVFFFNENLGVMTPSGWESLVDSVIQMEDALLTESSWIASQGILLELR